jgi:DNA ligase (NAD+)
MDIEGLGDAVAGMLVDKGIIRDISSIYDLTKDELLKLDRFADKSAGNLIDAIEKSKDNDLHRLIYAIGIRHIGERSAWVLAEEFKSIAKLAAAGIEELMEIKEIGPVVAESVHSFFRTKKNLDIIDKLIRCGVRAEKSKASAAGGVFDGKTIVVTGSLEEYSRQEAEQIIRKLGGVPSSSVSKNTAFVLCGALPGSKVKKAAELGIRIINETEFKKMIGGK